MVVDWFLAVVRPAGVPGVRFVAGSARASSAPAPVPRTTPPWLHGSGIAQGLRAAGCDVTNEKLVPRGAQMQAVCGAFFF